MSKTNQIPEGWEVCSIEEAEKAWTPWDPGADIGTNEGVFKWVVTPGDNHIYPEDWDVLGIIPIRKVKQEPFEKVVTAGVDRICGQDQDYIKVNVPRPGKYRVVEVIE